MLQLIVPGLIDPDRVDDVFFEGFASMELVGGDGCVRLTLFVTRDMGDGEIDRIVVARLVASRSTLETGLQQLTDFNAGKRFIHDVRSEQLN